MLQCVFDLKPQFGTGSQTSRASLRAIEVCLKDTAQLGWFFAALPLRLLDGLNTSKL